MKENRDKGVTHREKKTGIENMKERSKDSEIVAKNSCPASPGATHFSKVISPTNDNQRLSQSAAPVPVTHLSPKTFIATSIPSSEIFLNARPDRLFAKASPVPSLPTRVGRCAPPPDAGLCRGPPTSFAEARAR